ncbi:MAG: flap endonuclease [Dehalococcoidia bacterium]|nr:flap endonuclease [Dehalococcoidia bacterium]
MSLYLVDGTFELFRAYYAMPPMYAPDGRPVAAVRGLLQTLITLAHDDDVTHLACAFDHVIESFRNRLFDGYKTGEGVPDDLASQFHLAERAASTLGMVVWPMVEFEADDAIATAAARWCGGQEAGRVVICSPDKDLAQMVRGDRVVCLDRRRETVLDEAGVREKFGVEPRSIPDYLALVGDANDGIPGVPRWGAGTSARLLSCYGHIENIPPDPAEWDVAVRGAAAASASLEGHRERAALYKLLATLRTDAPIEERLEDLRWTGVLREPFRELCGELGFQALVDQPRRWRDAEDRSLP